MTVPAEAADDGKRATLKRVRTGCLTCRIRRVKCDEEKPHCRRCVSTGRKCDGYLAEPAYLPRVKSAQSSSRRRQRVSSDDQSARVTPRYRPLCLLAFEEDYESRNFEYYHIWALFHGQYGASFDSSDWHRLAYEAAQIEPTIKYLFLTLSPLVQQSGAFLSPTKPKLDRKIAFQYHKAIASAKDLLARAKDRDDVNIALIACALFVCTENTLGNYSSAWMHLQSGLKILKERPFDWHRIDATHESEETIEMMLQRLDLQAMTLTDAENLYPYSLEAALSMDEAELLASSKSNSGAVNLIRVSLHLGMSLWQIAEKYLTCELEQLQNLLRKRGLYVDAMLERRKCTLNEKTTDPKTTLMMLWQTTISLFLIAGTCGDARRWDDYLDDFRLAIELAEKLYTTQQNASARHALSNFRSTSSEMGLIPPLFCIIQQCRDPEIRYRGLRLLESAERRESGFDCTDAARFLRYLVQAEEEATGTPIAKAEDVPESARVYLWSGKIDEVRQKFVVTVTFKQRKEAANYSDPFNSDFILVQKKQVLDL